ncbi:potassium transporter [Aspergillus terreus]|uniref:Potassium transporter n=1 Tax=Aspergillus terreus TaxID=33178 RepID=A0A5M3YLN5_ASPTE|nr:hypothetical protein ATETN484_0001046100 [Aspergillus terreus]GFF12317.1 potassium transporter [Aspergillus terreus]
MSKTVSTIEADEDPVLRKPGDYKEKQVFKGRMLLWLAYQSIGVIYGDIGTSPLYVYSSTSEAPSREDLIGVLSIIIWSLFMMVTVKYVLIILNADNDGEGGTFSTYSLLSRYMNITQRDPREASLVQMKRHMSVNLQPPSRHARHGLESSKTAKRLLKTMGVLAVTMVIADGLLTPAQSVLGAVQGIKVVSPNISKGTIIGVTDAILVALFLVQPFGITKITVAFAPIVIIWLAFNAVFGYTIWPNMTPAYSLPSIQDARSTYISVHPEAYSNPFFNAAPPGTIYPSLVIAILAAIVASQAIITATFQTTSLGNAYGVCVMFVTFFDTCMVSLVALFVWRTSTFIILLPWLIIACLDGAYLSAALTKVPMGAWFTLALASVLAILFLLWRFGKERQWFAEAEDRFPTAYFVAKAPNGQMKLTDRFGGAPLTTTRGLGIFFDKAGETTPIVFSQFVLKLTSMPEVNVFFHLRPLEVPSVTVENRYTVSRLAIPNCYRLVVRYGYNDEIMSPNLADTITEQVHTFASRVVKTERDDGSLEKLENAYAHGVIYITGKEEMKIKKSRNHIRRIALWLFLLARENTRSKITSLGLQTERVIELGFVKEI